MGIIVSTYKPESSSVTRDNRKSIQLSSFDARTEGKSKQPRSEKSSVIDTAQPPAGESRKSIPRSQDDARIEGKGKQPRSEKSTESDVSLASARESRRSIHRSQDDARSEGKGKQPRSEKSSVMEAARASSSRKLSASDAQAKQAKSKKSSVANTNLKDEKSTLPKPTKSSTADRKTPGDRSGVQSKVSGATVTLSPRPDMEDETKPHRISVIDTYQECAGESDDQPLPKPQTVKKDQIFQEDKFQHVRTHTAKAPQKLLSGTFYKLVSYLAKASYSDLEKVRAIFLWQTSIDIEGLEQVESPANSPMDYLLRIKQGTGSHARLFYAMCRMAQIPCKIVRGMTKSSAYELGNKVDRQKMGSKWNAVCIDDNWFLIDVLWASVTLQVPVPDGWVPVDTDLKIMSGDKEQNEQKTVYQLNEFYFLPDADQLIYTHFPDLEAWQLLKQPITVDEFENHFYIREMFHIIGMKTPEKGHIDCKLEIPDGTIEIYFSLCHKTSEFYKFKHMLAQFTLDQKENEKLGEFLGRYVFFEQTPKEVGFCLRLPIKGLFKMDICALDTRKSADFELACSYLINCQNSNPNLKPFPDKPQIGWGPGTKLKGAGLTAMSHQCSIIRTKNGKVDIVFEASKDTKVLLFANLKHDELGDKTLNDYTVTEYKDDKLIARIRLPKEGEYSLNLNSKGYNTPKDPANVCNYLILCEGQKDKFPIFEDKAIGFRYVAESLGVIAESHTGGLVEAKEGHEIVQFHAPSNVQLMCEMDTYDEEAKKTMVVLVKDNEGNWNFDINLFNLGEYSMHIFAKCEDTGQDHVCVHSYLVTSTGKPIELRQRQLKYGIKNGLRLENEEMMVEAIERYKQFNPPEDDPVLKEALEDLNNFRLKKLRKQIEADINKAVQLEDANLLEQLIQKYLETNPPADDPVPKKAQEELERIKMKQLRSKIKEEIDDALKKGDEHLLQDAINKYRNTNPPNDDDVVKKAEDGLKKLKHNNLYMTLKNDLEDALTKKDIPLLEDTIKKYCSSNLDQEDPILKKAIEELENLKKEREREQIKIDIDNAVKKGDMKQLEEAIKKYLQTNPPKNDPVLKKAMEDLERLKHEHQLELAKDQIEKALKMNDEKLLEEAIAKYEEIGDKRDPFLMKAIDELKKLKHKNECAKIQGEIEYAVKMEDEQLLEDAIKRYQELNPDKKDPILNKAIEELKRIKQKQVSSKLKHDIEDALQKGDDNLLEEAIKRYATAVGKDDPFLIKAQDELKKLRNKKAQEKAKEELEEALKTQDIPAIEKAIKRYHDSCLNKDDPVLVNAMKELEDLKLKERRKHLADAIKNALKSGDEDQIEEAIKKYQQTKPPEDDPVLVKAQEELKTLKLKNARDKIEDEINKAISNGDVYKLQKAIKCYKQTSPDEDDPVLEKAEKALANLNKMKARHEIEEEIKAAVKAGSKETLKKAIQKYKDTNPDEDDPVLVAAIKSLKELEMKQLREKLKEDMEQAVVQDDEELMEKIIKEYRETRPRKDDPVLKEALEDLKEMKTRHQREKIEKDMRNAVNAEDDKLLEKAIKEYMDTYPKDDDPVLKKAQEDLKRIKKNSYRNKLIAEIDSATSAGDEKLLEEAIRKYLDTKPEKDDPVLLKAQEDLKQLKLKSLRSSLEEQIQNALHQGDEELLDQAIKKYLETKPSKDDPVLVKALEAQKQLKQKKHRKQLEDEIKKAIHAGDLHKLEAAIKKFSEVADNDDPLLQKAQSELINLRGKAVRNKLKEEIENAINKGDENLLEELIQKYLETNPDKNDPVLKNAQDVLKRLKTGHIRAKIEEEIRAAVRTGDEQRLEEAIKQFQETNPKHDDPVLVKALEDLNKIKLKNQRNKIQEEIENAVSNEDLQLLEEAIKKYRETKPAADDPVLKKALEDLNNIKLKQERNKIKEQIDKALQDQDPVALEKAIKKYQDTDPRDNDPVLKKAIDDLKELKKKIIRYKALKEMEEALEYGDEQALEEAIKKYRDTKPPSDDPVLLKALEDLKDLKLKNLRAKFASEIDTAVNNDDEQMLEKALKKYLETKPKKDDPVVIKAQQSLNYMKQKHHLKKIEEEINEAIHAGDEQKLENAIKKYSEICQNENDPVLVKAKEELNDLKVKKLRNRIKGEIEQAVRKEDEQQLDEAIQKYMDTNPDKNDPVLKKAQEDLKKLKFKNLRNTLENDIKNALRSGDEQKMEEAIQKYQESNPAKDDPVLIKALEDLKELKLKHLCKKLKEDIDKAIANDDLKLLEEAIEKYPDKNDPVFKKALEELEKLKLKQQRQQLENEFHDAMNAEDENLAEKALEKYMETKPKKDDPFLRKAQDDLKKLKTKHQRNQLEQEIEQAIEKGDEHMLEKALKKYQETRPKKDDPVLMKAQEALDKLKLQNHLKKLEDDMKNALNEGDEQKLEAAIKKYQEICPDKNDPVLIKALQDLKDLKTKNKRNKIEEDINKAIKDGDEHMLERALNKYKETNPDKNDPVLIKAERELAKLKLSNILEHALRNGDEKKLEEAIQKYKDTNPDKNDPLLKKAEEDLKNLKLAKQRHLIEEEIRNSAGDEKKLEEALNKYKATNPDPNDPVLLKAQKQLDELKLKNKRDAIHKEITDAVKNGDDKKLEEAVKKYQDTNPDVNDPVLRKALEDLERIKTENRRKKIADDMKKAIEAGDEKALEQAIAEYRETNPDSDDHVLVQALKDLEKVKLDNHRKNIQQEYQNAMNSHDVDKAEEALKQYLETNPDRNDPFVRKAEEDLKALKEQIELENHRKDLQKQLDEAFAEGDEKKVEELIRQYQETNPGPEDTVVKDSKEKLEKLKEENEKLRVKLNEEIKNALANGDDKRLAELTAKFRKLNLNDENREVLRKAQERVDYLQTKEDLVKACETRDLKTLREAMKKAENMGDKGIIAKYREAARVEMKRMEESEKLLKNIMSVEHTKVSEMKSYPKPNLRVQVTMAATLVLLGTPQHEVNNWHNTVTLVWKIGKDGLLKKMMTFNPADMPLSLAKTARSILGGLTLKEIRSASSSAASFFEWTDHMIKEIQDVKGEGDTDLNKLRVLNEVKSSENL